VPELPEVETIVRELRPFLEGRCFTDVRILVERALDGLRALELKAALIGRRIRRVSRRGKYIIISLEEGGHLLVHLRMTGQLLIEDAADEVPRHTSALFLLDDGKCLRFSDVRKLGKIYFADELARVVGHLGPEPLEPDFTPESLRERLARRKACIKSLLLDQRFLAGVGNIYADEALFLARIHPLRRACSLSSEEVEHLYQAIQTVLWEGIVHRGTTLPDGQYRDPFNRVGENQARLRVFRRRGHPCPRCGASIQRIVVAGRGTYFCPQCQKPE